MLLEDTCYDPSRNTKYTEAFRHAKEVVYKDYVPSISFTNNVDIWSLDVNILGQELGLYHPPNVDATNPDSSIV